MSSELEWADVVSFSGVVGEGYVSNSTMNIRVSCLELPMAARIYRIVSEATVYPLVL